MEQIKLVVGFITYGETTAKYLSYFLPSLFAQDFKDFKILAIDNTEIKSNANREYIEKNYPQLELKWAGENLGFARAYNLMIQQAVESGAEYFLAVNPDMMLLPNLLSVMVAAMKSDDKIAVVAPKILRWDFSSNKTTKQIDSMGLKFKNGLRFYDLGQGEIDGGQYNQAAIDGASGAAALYRLSALNQVAQDGQYFDELMFMYKEDCDLAYRLHLAGYSSKLASRALAYHDRSISAQGESNLEIALNRKNKSRQNKKWSFLNQNIIFLKYWRRQNWFEKAAIIWWELKMFLFILFFEQYLFKEYTNLWKIKNKIKF